MKKALLTLFVLLAAGLCAFAQEDNNRDENGKIVRGPYETNKLWDNWFVSLGGGVNWTADGVISKNLEHGFGPAIDVMFGKWFDPCFGVRMGWQGLFSKVEGEVSDGKRFDLDYIHGDVLWNLSNQIWGYKETRIYNLVPYVHWGVMFANGRELAGGFGLLNNFRVAEHWTIYADVRGLLTRGEQFIQTEGGLAGNLSLTAGVTYNILKSNWTRSNTAALTSEVNDAKSALADAEKALADAEKANDELAQANDELEKENEELKEAASKVDTVYVDNREKCPTFYFDINKSTLSEDEQARVKDYVENADKDKSYIVAGYADKGTGSSALNSALAYKRALHVGYLFIKYGMPNDKVRATSGGAVEGDETQARAVTVYCE
ncbi:MAG: OmpA family protein [Bacteroidales bacterium]|nr:OmpA family protein [Bacteroidales bacterium]